MKPHTKSIFAAITLAATLMAPRVRAQFLNEISPEAMQQIQAIQAEKGSRTGVQKKIDSNLLYALKMERGQPVAAGIPTLATGVQADNSGAVTVFVRGTIDTALLSALRGMSVEVVASYPAQGTVRIR